MRQKGGKPRSCPRARATLLGWSPPGSLNVREVASGHWLGKDRGRALVPHVLGPVPRTCVKLGQILQHATAIYFADEEVEVGRREACLRSHRKSGAEVGLDSRSPDATCSPMAA